MSDTRRRSTGRKYSGWTAASSGSGYESLLLSGRLVRGGECCEGGSRSAEVRNVKDESDW